MLRGAVKGAGADCGTFLAENAIDWGIVDRATLTANLKLEHLENYSHDWFCNTSEDRYLFAMLRHARQIMETICRGTVDAKPGCFVLFRAVRSPLYNHGGIVTEWPRILHACDPMVQESNVHQHHLTSFCEMAIFDPWAE